MPLIPGELEALIGGLSAVALVALMAAADAVEVPVALHGWLTETQAAEMRRRSGAAANFPPLHGPLGRPPLGWLKAIDAIMLQARGNAGLTVVERDRLLSFLRALRAAL